MTRKNAWKCASADTIFADADAVCGVPNLLSQMVGFGGVPDICRIGGVDVAKAVLAVFVVAAERNIAVGRHNHCAAQAEAVGAELPFCAD